tara:strand:- start:208 stop:393 length:186 start_codon:yes stop_codon:yes gene_type:complete
MQTELTWRMWLKNEKNRKMLKEHPTLAKKQFLVEQDKYRRKWDYLGNTWLNSTTINEKGNK